MNFDIKRIATGEWEGCVNTEYTVRGTTYSEVLMKLEMYINREN